MSRASALYRLQELDLQLDQRHTRLSEIDQELHDDALTRAIHQRALEVEAQLKAARVSQRSLEYDIQVQNEKIAEIEVQLYGGGVSNTKELQDLQKDVESRRRRRAGVEEQQFEALMRVETAEIELARTLEGLTHAEEEEARHKTHLAEERDRLLAQVAQLESDHEVAAASVPAADRAVYARLRQAKKGHVVALLADGVCAACGVEPASSQMQIVRQGHELTQCPNCERILYAE